MAKKRINGEGTVWYVASEKRYRAQYPAGGKRRTPGVNSGNCVDTKQIRVTLLTNH